MAILQKQVELKLWERLYVGAILGGLWITLKHFLRQIFTPSRQRFTIQYPDWKKPMPEGYRGFHELKRKEDGSVVCVACFMCAEACPARCITIEAEEFSDLNLTQGFDEKRPRIFEIDLLRCIYCGYCEEACPEDAIWLRKGYEKVSLERGSLNYGKWDLLNHYADEDGKPILRPEEEVPALTSSSLPS